MSLKSHGHCALKVRTPLKKKSQAVFRVLKSLDFKTGPRRVRSGRTLLRAPVALPASFYASSELLSVRMETVGISPIFFFLLFFSPICRNNDMDQCASYTKIHPFGSVLSFFAKVASSHSFELSLTRDHPTSLRRELAVSLRRREEEAQALTLLAAPVY